MNKERIYDKFINPLMARIIKICDEHNIAPLCSFAIPTEESPGLGCTTALLDKKRNPPEYLLRCAAIIQRLPDVDATQPELVCDIKEEEPVKFCPSSSGEIIEILREATASRMLGQALRQVHKVSMLFLGVDVSGLDCDMAVIAVADSALAQHLVAEVNRWVRKGDEDGRGSKSLH